MSKTTINNILLRGYYGYGNFGDDLLMVITYEYIRGLYPTANIDVFTFNSKEDYINKLIPNAHVKRSLNTSYDLIVHGGGGVYFDFNKGNALDYIFNLLMNMLGPKIITKFIVKARQMRGISTENTRYRLGLGIGVGSFTKSSKKLRSSQIAISSYDTIMVRDKTSMHNWKKLNHKIDPILGTDLAFNRPYDDSKYSSDGPIGIVLRKGENDQYNKSIIDYFKSHYDLEQLCFFLFDGESDYAISELIPKKCQIWSKENINSFADYIGMCKIVVTSRAHGAIVAASYGVPSLILGIEPKLQTIYNMFPNSSVLIELQDSNLKLDFSSKIDNAGHLRDQIKQDYLNNQQKLKTALRSIEKTLVSL